MTFQEFFDISESLDYTPSDIKKTITNRPTEVDISYEFSVDSLNYDVVFSIKKDTKSVSFMFSITNEGYENPMSILNTGSSHKVFGAVANIFKKFLMEYVRQIKDISFTANKKDSSRVKLYDRFVGSNFIKTNFDVDIDDRDAIRIYILTPKINANNNNL